MNPTASSISRAEYEPPNTPAKLKELENALDGLFDEIMTPSDHHLGGDMTLPERAWKHSKTINDDEWRRDKPNSSAEINTPAFIKHGHFSLQNSSPCTPSKSKDIISTSTALTPSVDEWCLRSEDDEDREGHEESSEDQLQQEVSPTRSCISSAADHPCTPTWPLSTTISLSETQENSLLTRKPPMLKAKAKAEAISSSTTSTPLTRSRQASSSWKACTFCFWLLCLMILFFAGMLSVVCLYADTEGVSASALELLSPLVKWQWLAEVGGGVDRVSDATGMELSVREGNNLSSDIVDMGISDSRDRVEYMQAESGSAEGQSMHGDDRETSGPERIFVRINLKAKRKPAELFDPAEGGEGRIDDNREEDKELLNTLRAEKSELWRQMRRDLEREMGLVDSGEALGDDGRSANTIASGADDMCENNHAYFIVNDTCSALGDAATAEVSSAKGSKLSTVSRILSALRQVKGSFRCSRIREKVLGVWHRFERVKTIQRHEI